MKDGIVLVNPGAQRQLFGDLAAAMTAREPPIMARMCSGYLSDRGVRTSIIDAEADDLSAEAVADLVEYLDMSHVAICASGSQPSASTQQMAGSGLIARAVKATNATRTVILLGNHPSALPERTLREETVDCVAVGEGPVTLLSLMNGADPRDALGLAWREGNRVVRNLAAPLIEDLDRDLHGNVFHQLPMARYRSHTWHAFTGPRRPYSSIYTTLGCPFACHFCMVNTIFDSNRYRRFSPGFVVGQIAHLYHSYGVRSIKLADEMFLLNESHYSDIAEGLIAAGLRDLNLWAYSRIDTVKPDRLDLLRRAGFKWLALGIESGSKYVRDGSNKRLRNDDVVDVVRTIQRADIAVVGNFIFGLPDDTNETMQETLDLALACLPEHANFYSAMPYPGSKLYDDALKSGTPMGTSWSAFSQHSQDCLPLPTATLSGLQVRAFRDAAWRRYFTDPAYLASIATKFGPSARAQVEAVTRVRLR